MAYRRNYSRPVTALINHGPIEEDDTHKPWFDYVGHYGLGEDHVSELIRLMTENYVGSKKYPHRHFAPIHACRALGQIGDSGADLFIVTHLDDVENAKLIESVLVALAMLGPSSLKVLEQYFEWPQPSLESQILVAMGFRVFAEQNPHCRDECVAFLTKTLSLCAEHNPLLNGFLVYNLIELKATESAEVIERAFQKNRVDVDVSGRWPDVKVQLGLASSSEFAPDELMGAGERNSL